MIKEIKRIREDIDREISRAEEIDNLLQEASKAMMKGDIDKALEINDELKELMNT